MRYIFSIRYDTIRWYRFISVTITDSSKQHSHNNTMQWMLNTYEKTYILVCSQIKHKTAKLDKQKMLPLWWYCSLHQQQKSSESKNKHSMINYSSNCNSECLYATYRLTKGELHCHYDYTVGWKSTLAAGYLSVSFNFDTILIRYLYKYHNIDMTSIL